jgi:hypothetical protein
MLLSFGLFFFAVLRDKSGKLRIFRLHKIVNQARSRTPSLKTCTRDNVKIVCLNFPEKRNQYAYLDAYLMKLLTFSSPKISGLIGLRNVSVFITPILTLI